MANLEARLAKLEQTAASEEPVYLIVVREGQTITEAEKQTAIARAEAEARQSPRGLHYPLAVFVDTQKPVFAP